MTPPWCSATGYWRRAPIRPAGRAAGCHRPPRGGGHGGAHGAGGADDAVPPSPGFPAARMSLACAIARAAGRGPGPGGGGLAARQASPRSVPASGRSAAYGAHRTDMVLKDAFTGAPAALASYRRAKGAADRRHPGAMPH